MLGSHHVCLNVFSFDSKSTREKRIVTMKSLHHDWLLDIRVIILKSILNLHAVVSSSIYHIIHSTKLTNEETLIMNINVVRLFVCGMQISLFPMH